MTAAGNLTYESAVASLHTKYLLLSSRGSDIFAYKIDCIMFTWYR
jgi:hypothetical protein